MAPPSILMTTPHVLPLVRSSANLLPTRQNNSTKSNHGLHASGSGSNYLIPIHRLISRTSPRAHPPKLRRERDGEGRGSARKRKEETEVLGRANADAFFQWIFSSGRTPGHVSRRLEDPLRFRGVLVNRCTDFMDCIAAFAPRGWSGCRLLLCCRQAHWHCVHCWSSTTATLVEYQCKHAILCNERYVIFC